MMVKKSMALLVIFIIMAACSFNQPDLPSWDTSWKFYLPLKTVNLEKIINDSTLVADTTDGHPLIKFKLQDSTDWVRVNQEDLSIEGINQTFEAQIGTIKLKDVSDVNSPPLTLNDLLPSELMTGDTIPPYPDFNVDPPADSVDYDFYKSAHIKSGTISLTFHNELFLTFKPGMRIIIYNNSGDSLLEIADIVFSDSIKPFTTVQSNVVDLSGKDISNHFLLKYTIPIQGSDTAQALTDAMRNGTCYTVLTIKNLEVSEAEAKIPDQSFSKDQQIALPQDEHKVIEAQIASGVITLDIRNNSNIQTDLHIEIPNIVRDGQAKTIDLNVQAQQSSTVPIDLSGWQIVNASRPGEPIDSIRIKIKATVGSGDQIVKISEKDGLQIGVRSTTIYFQQIKGILAPIEQEISPQTIDISDMFKNVSGQGLNLDDLRLILDFDNQIDIPIKMHLKIGAYHEDGGQVDSLIMVVDKTIEASGVAPTTQFVFDKNSTSPSIVDLIAILPTRITVSGLATVEGQGSVRVDDGIRSRFLIESPLAYRLTQPLVFKTDMDSIKKEDIDDDMRTRLTDDLSELTLHLNISNGTPIGAAIRLILAADSTQLMDETITDSTRKMVIAANLEAGQVDNNGYVQKPTDNEVVVRITHTQAQLFNYSPIYLQQTVTFLPTGDKKVVVQTNNEIGFDAYFNLKFRVDLNK